MSTQNLISELEHEKVSTLKLLERLPENKLSWQPHEKAMTLGQLALHVATIPGRIASFADDGETKVDTLIDHPFSESKSDILESFHKSISKAASIINDANEEWDAKEWNLIQNGDTILTLPRPLFSRLLLANHWYHHRGELTTYLRILDVKIPSIYGPSADENPFA